MMSSGYCFVCCQLTMACVFISLFQSFISYCLGVSQATNGVLSWTLSLSVQIVSHSSPPLPHRVDRWRAVLICLSTGTISFLSRRSVLLFRIVSLQVISHSCPGIEGVVLDCLSAGNISVLSRCSMVLSCVQVVSYSCPGDQWCCIPVQVISSVVLCTGVPYSCPGDQWCCLVYRSYLIPVQVISGVVLCTGRTLFLSRWSVVLSWTVCV